VNEPRTIADRDPREPTQAPDLAAGPALARAKSVPWKALLLIWLVASLAGFWVAVYLDMKAASLRLGRDAQGLRSELTRNADLNDAILTGLAAALDAVSWEGLGSGARIYARKILEQYPHVHLVGVAQRVEGPERAVFESRMRANGWPDFQLRRFDYDLERQWHPVPEKAVYYPAVLVEPEREDTLPMIGLDMDAVPHMRHALLHSLQRQGVTPSDAFHFTGGDLGYVVVYPLCPSGGAGTCDLYGTSREPELVAVLGVLVERLVGEEDAAVRSPALSYAVYRDWGARDADSALFSREGFATLLERRLLPRLGREFRAGEATSQPFRVAISEQMTFASLNPWPYLGVLMASLAGLTLLLRLRQLQERIGSAEAAALQRFHEHRLQLQERVRVRTQALSRANEDLREQIEARLVAEERLRLKNEQMKLLARRMLEAQEKERRALALELHDGISQALTAIRVYAKLIAQERHESDDTTGRHAGLIMEMDGTIYDDTHAMMRRLRPRALDDLGLVASLEACAQQVGLHAQGITVHMHIDPDLKDLEGAAAITLYRLLQEALTNVSMHSQAQNVWVRAEWQADASGRFDDVPLVTLNVEDDGCGLPESDVVSSGLGLMGASERVTALGGDFEVTTGDAGGVRLRATLPIG
jgi:two-component system sensor histidine kinase UhpB